MNSSHRFKMANIYFRKAFTADGIKKLITRPSSLVDFVKMELFDVNLRPISLKDQLRTEKNTIQALSRVPQFLGRQVSVKSISAETGAEDRDEDLVDLEGLFNKYGSDKSGKHNYHLIYSRILREKRNLPLAILEIGLGTNNLDIPSNMGLRGKPGASLRAFRDWAPNAKVYGADVDTRVLFSEERIETFFVDQTDVAALQALANRFPPRSFDLIIDDGLHNSEANVNTLLFALQLLKDDGVIVIEDVAIDDLPVWQIAIALLESSYECDFVQTKGACVVVVRRRN